MIASRPIAASTLLLTLGLMCSGVPGVIPGAARPQGPSCPLAWRGGQVRGTATVPVSARTGRGAGAIGAWGYPLGMAAPERSSRPAPILVRLRLIDLPPPPA